MSALQVPKVGERWQVIGTPKFSVDIDEVAESGEVRFHGDWLRPGRKLAIDSFHLMFEPAPVRAVPLEHERPCVMPTRMEGGSSSPWFYSALAALGTALAYVIACGIPGVRP